MPGFLRVVLLLPLIAPAAAADAIYLCKADDGSAVYRDFPCPPDSSSTVVAEPEKDDATVCSRGTRFGVHSMSENMSGDPFYPRLMTSAWFDAGIRETDIRDPYHPKEVAHFIAPVNSFTQPSSWTVNGVKGSSLDVSCDNTDVDDRGYLYCGDRVGGGLDIVKLTGRALQIGLGKEKE